MSVGLVNHEAISGAKEGLSQWPDLCRNVQQERDTGQCSSPGPNRHKVGTAYNKI